MKSTVDGIDFQNKHVSVDEAGLNTQMMRSRAWLNVGERANRKAHDKKGGQNKRC